MMDRAPINGQIIPYKMEVRLDVDDKANSERMPGGCDKRWDTIYECSFCIRGQYGLMPKTVWPALNQLADTIPKFQLLYARWNG